MSTAEFARIAFLSGSLTFGTLAIVVIADTLHHLASDRDLIDARWIGWLSLVTMVLWTLSAVCRLIS